MHLAQTTRFPRFGRPPKDDAAARRQIQSTRVVLEEPADAEKLLALCKTDAEELGAVLEAAWALLLRCYTSQDHVSFGVYHAGSASSSSPGDEPGPAVVQLLLDDSVSVSELLDRAKTETSAVTHSHRVGDRPDPPISIINTAIMLWGFAPAPQPTIVSPLPKLHHNQQLRLLVKQHGQGNLGLFLEWNSKLTGMPAAQGALVSRTLARIVSSLLSSKPDARISQLDYLSRANLDQICAWNEAYPIQPLERCIHHVIADRVLEHPDAEAVCAWDGSLSYRELDSLAGSLATRLVQRGAGPETLVPLCFEKSVCANPRIKYYPSTRLARPGSTVPCLLSLEMDSGGNARRTEGGSGICSPGPIPSGREAPWTLRLGQRTSRSLLPPPSTFAYPGNR